MPETDLKTEEAYRKAIAETEACKKLDADLGEAEVKYRQIENDKVSEGDFLNKQAVMEAAEAVIRLRMIPAKRAKVEARLAACIEAEAAAQQALGKELYELVIQIAGELPAVYTRALKPFFGSEDIGFVVQGVLNTAALPGLVAIRRFGLTAASRDQDASTARIASSGGVSPPRSTISRNCCRC